MTLMLPFGAWLAAFLIMDAGHRQPTGRTGPLSFGLTGAVFGVVLLGLTGSLVLLFLGPALALAGAGLFHHERARRQRLLQLRQLPIVVDILSRHLAVGATVAAAIAGLDQSQREASGLETPLARIRSGVATADALASAPGLLGAALYAAELAGGSGGMAIERLADRLRSAALDGRAAQAQSGQQLASAGVMTLMPPVVSLLYALSDERAANFYLHTPWGAVVVIVSLALSAIGWFWMRYITRPRGIA